ncbi:EamA family transporter [Actinomadura scrupuli]|uniref:EamA family transporter n=1 Tax=Actinomadura scrupuli TaxID=559629 RepID=UPI003D96B1AF
MRTPRAGLLFALVSAIGFGWSGPLAKALLDGGLDPLQTVWIRLAGGALVLLAVTVVLRPRALLIPRHQIPAVAAYSLIGFAAVQAFYYSSVARLPVGIAVLLEYTSPILVVLWVRVVRRTRLPRTALAGPLVVLVGLTFVVGIWDGAGIDPFGLLLGLGTAACAAAYFLLIPQAGDQIHPLGSLTWGLLGAVAALTPMARPWALPWHVLGRDLQVGGRVLPAAVVCAGLVLVGTVLAYVTSIVAVRTLSAAVGATVASLEVLASIVVAWLLLGQSLTAVQLAGAMIMLAGALLAQSSLSRRPATAEEAAPPVGVETARSPAREPQPG